MSPGSGISPGSRSTESQVGPKTMRGRTSPRRRLPSGDTTCIRSITPIIGSSTIVP
jgi:hypothetical protein